MIYTAKYQQEGFELSVCALLDEADLISIYFAISAKTKKPHFLLSMGDNLIFHPYVHPLDVRLLMDDFGLDRNLLRVIKGKLPNY